MKNRVEYFFKKLCKEMNITESLIEENDELKDQILRCKICLEERLTHCFPHCHHLVACKKCAQKVDNCVICRTAIESRFKIYL